MSTAIDVAAMLRVGLVFSHLIGLGAAVGAMALADYAIFGSARIDQHLLKRCSRAVALSLAVLWVTGVAIIGWDTRFDFAVMAGSAKMLAKITVATMLTLNGVMLHRWAFPRLRQAQRNPWRAALLPALFGATSKVSWIFAVLLGIGKALTPALGYAGFMMLYGAALLAGAAVALVFFRQPLAQRMAAPSDDATLVAAAPAHQSSTAKAARASRAGPSAARSNRPRRERRRAPHASSDPGR